MSMDASGALPEQQSVQTDITQQQVGPSGTTTDENLANLASIDQSSLLNAPQQAAKGNGQLPGMGPDLQMQQFVNSDQYASQQRQAMLAQQNMQQQLDQLSMEAATGYFAAPQYAYGAPAPVQTSGKFTGGVEQWRGVVSQALRAAGLPDTPENQNLTLNQMRTESGGNPNAINNWDINAKNGDPSRGLMQTIGTTFNAYAGPYASRGIYDPLANIYASLKYAISRYGSLAAAYRGHGY